MQYKAVGFDYGGVIKGSPGSVFNSRVCELLGITKEQYQTAYYHHNKKLNRGEITWPELWALVLTELGHPDQVANVMALSDAAFGQTINQAMLNLVDIIKKKGYKVGLLSNNTIEAGQTMRKLGIDKHFDVLHVSAETQLVKPEPEAFTFFANELGVNLNQLIFIDDAEKSLSTSKECGFTPILFESYESLVQRLTDLKVL